jgi:hypothetical protein
MSTGLFRQLSDALLLKRCAAMCGSLALTFLTAAPAAAQPPDRLPRELRIAVDKAIDQGILALKRHQAPWGSWCELKDAHVVGFAALPALTLLECGVDPRYPGVQQAAQLIRAKIGQLEQTYDISLAILFLDRLGDPKDPPLIQLLALRLVAGQAQTGGWNYKCPIPTIDDSATLAALLKQLQPESPEAKEPKKVWIPPGFQGLPVLVDPDRLPLAEPVIRKDELFWGTTDNSNTQFALLALWAARRHGVPLDRSFHLLVRRFETSQNADGAWGYAYRRGGGEGGSPAMTGVGLIGLAVGHGLANEPKAKGGPTTHRRRLAKDERVVKGFAAFGNHIGVPTGRMRDLPQPSLYFMWTVERVGVLYKLKQIGKKDWYHWGAEILVANQRPDGAWDKGGYHGAVPAIDTCMALLFLKQANFTEDLTDRIVEDAADLNLAIIQETPEPTPPPNKKEPPSVTSGFPVADRTQKKEPEDSLPSRVTDDSTDRAPDDGARHEPGTRTNDPRGLPPASTAAARVNQPAGTSPAAVVLVVVSLLLLLGAAGFVIYHQTRRSGGPSAGAAGIVDQKRSSRPE